MNHSFVLCCLKIFLFLLSFCFFNEINLELNLEYYTIYWYEKFSQNFQCFKYFAVLLVSLIKETNGDSFLHYCIVNRTIYRMFNTSCRLPHRVWLTSLLIHPLLSWKVPQQLLLKSLKFHDSLLWILVWFKYLCENQLALALNILGYYQSNNSNLFLISANHHRDLK